MSRAPSGGAPALVYLDDSEAADRLRCAVCLTDPIDPHLCRECAHHFCHACLLAAHRVSGCCPHCRKKFQKKSFIRVPWIEEHLTALRTARRVEDPANTAAAPASMGGRSAPASVEAKDEGRCPHHPGKEISVFCQDCSVPVCTACWAALHLGHKVFPIEAVGESGDDPTSRNRSRFGGSQPQAGPSKRVRFN